MLNVFVINLETSSARWEKVSQRLEHLGIPYERFDAVDGRLAPHPLFERYDDELRERYRRRALCAGELGCFASHFLLWQRCVELNQAIVVMEDDVVINSSFGEAVEIAEHNIEQLRFLRLAGTSLHRRPYKKIKPLAQFELIDHIRGPCGTLCYVIHPEAAKALIAHADIWFMAVDDYIDRYWSHQVDSYSLMPFPVTVGDSTSDILRPPKEHRSLRIKIKQELYGRLERLRRLKYRMFRVLYSLYHRPEQAAENEHS